MKQAVFFLLSFMMLVSCSDLNDTPDATQEKTDSQLSEIRTPEEALSLAQTALGFDSNKSRSDHKMSKADIVIVGSKNSSRSEASDTIIYAVNSGENDGFVLVAAPRSCKNPILGIAESGTYSEDIATLDNFGYYMDKARAYPLNLIQAYT